jgi:hypothetical protein
LDHDDCILRHLADRGTLDTDGVRHSAKLAWRALAMLQTELEAAGYPPGRASKFPSSGQRTVIDVYKELTAVASEGEARKQFADRSSGQYGSPRSG